MITDVMLGVFLGIWLYKITDGILKAIVFKD